jgi:hypothetical protein
MSFSNLKKSSKSSLDKINQQVSKLAAPEGEGRKQDTRFWQPEVDKSGNGYAVIRFLPSPDNEDVPFVRIFDHGFQGPGGQWYIEKSLTTIGKADPVSEYNSQLWATKLQANQDQVRKQKRKLNFISNIYVVSDKAHPENEGKVFLFKYGKKIFDKLNAAMNPEFEDEEPINPFDFWAGANFKLKIRNVEGYRNYDKSEFEAPAMGNNEEQSFWMKNCIIPLDIVFINDDMTIQSIQKNCPPCSSNDCEHYPGNGKYVLELLGGTCEECGIENGQKIKISY